MTFSSENITIILEETDEYHYEMIQMIQQLQI